MTILINMVKGLVERGKWRIGMQVKRALAVICIVSIMFIQI